MNSDPLNAEPAQAEIPLVLSISMVTFNQDLEELRGTLESLELALQPFARDEILITLIDNSRSDRVSALLENTLSGRKTRFFFGHGNVGFGRAHNMALDRFGEFHLILNPDIQLQPDSLEIAVDFMRGSPSCALASPYAEWPDGQRQYLCKRFPAVFDLLLRGFAPASIRRLFSKRLAKYEMQTETQDRLYCNPPIVSGCFMFFRSSFLNNLNGFNEKYFLYFEDFDLSLRASEKYSTAYVPGIRIVHSGGHAARKGFWHIRQFVRSAIRFYGMHGIKLF